MESAPSFFLARIAIRIPPRVEPQGIALNIPPQTRVVVPEAIVEESGLGVKPLARKAQVEREGGKPRGRGLSWQLVPKGLLGVPGPAGLTGTAIQDLAGRAEVIRQDGEDPRVVHPNHRVWADHGHRPPPIEVHVFLLDPEPVGLAGIRDIHAQGTADFVVGIQARARGGLSCDAL